MRRAISSGASRRSRSAAASAHRYRPDVGGRGTVRHALVGLDLHIVGWQGVVRIGHGRLKEGKRSLGHAREHLAHIPGWALRLARGLLQIGQGEGKGGP